MLLDFVFERLMETVLRDLSDEACLIYLDDIIIVGLTFEKDLNNFRKMLEKLKMTNLRLNPSKFNLCYLGDICDEDVRANPGRIFEVENWYIR